MNVRLRFNADLRTAAWFSDQFMVNNFSINLQLITKSQNPEDHPVCMGRIRTILDQLEHQVFISSEYTDKIQELNRCGVRTVTFPQQPIDQIVGIVLFEKLNAVLEGRMRVTDLDICSDLGDNIWFMHSDNETVSAIARSGWWADPTPVCVSLENLRQEKKVVKLQKQLTWKSLDLDWGSGQSAETVIINIKDEK